MTTIQWAPGYDNEAGYVDMIIDPADKALVFFPGLSHPIYVRTGALTMAGKGALRCRLRMENITFAQYTTMRETDLGFTSSESDISKQITIKLPEPDRVTFNDWNAMLTHRPGVDTELNDSHTLYERVYWDVVIVSAT